MLRYIDVVIGIALFGLVDPCALPFWWNEQFSFPPYYSQSSSPPKTTYHYRETFSGSDPNNFLHVKEYSEYSWWENNFSDKSGSDFPLGDPGNGNGNGFGPKGSVGSGGSNALDERSSRGGSRDTSGGSGESTTVARSDERERKDDEKVVVRNDDLGNGAESSGVEVQDVPTTSSTETSRRGYFDDFFGGASLNETEPCKVSGTDIHSLRSMLEKMFSFPRDDMQNGQMKEKAREDIMQKFRDFGLQVWTQNFSSPPVLGPEGTTYSREGVNLVGVIPGANRGQLDDGIVLVGAHYDTVQASNGVDDNGSGVAVMLEVARALTQARCRFNNTLMFVAFDMEEDGAIGSNYFVDHYLIPEELKRARAHFQGAFILDGIMNYNDAPNTQELPFDYAESLPGLQHFVNHTGNRGNFLAMISRNNIDSHLTKQLMVAWQDLGDHQYKLYNLAVNMGGHTPPPPVISSHLNFLRSDHATFWYHNSSTHFPETLNAVLLTDTGPYRGQMKQCYHNKCDDLTVMSSEKLQFAKKTADALTATLVELTRATGAGNISKEPVMALLIQLVFLCIFTTKYYV